MWAGPYSIANPPASPFDPKRGSDTKPVFGNDVKYLFSPQVPVPDHRPSAHQPSSPWSWNGNNPSMPTPDTPDVHMNDVTPPPAAAAKEKLELVREGEEIESPEVRRMSNAAVKRVERSRRRTKGRNWTARRRARTAGDGESDESDEEEDDEDGRALAPVKQSTSNHYTLNMPGPAVPASDTPYILLGYLLFSTTLYHAQLTFASDIFNFYLICLSFWFSYISCFSLFSLCSTMLSSASASIPWVSSPSTDSSVSDLDVGLWHREEILQDITTCTTLYKTNLCDTSPIPAMMHQCAAWETCMARDPRIVGRAKVGAEMLAEVVNGFVEPISWKTLVRFL